MMIRKHTVAAVLGTVLLVPALLTGCSTTTGGADPSSGRTPAPGSAEQDAAIGSCMRAAGFDWDDSADAQFSIPDGVDAAAYTAALERCVSSHGGGEAAAPVGGTPESDAALAECLTAAGLPDVPERQDDFETWIDNLAAVDQQTLDAHIRECSAKAIEAGQ